MMYSAPSTTSDQLLMMRSPKQERMMVKSSSLSSLPSPATPTTTTTSSTRYFSTPTSPKLKQRHSIIIQQQQQQQKQYQRIVLYCCFVILVANINNLLQFQKSIQIVLDNDDKLSNNDRRRRNHHQYYEYHEQHHHYHPILATQEATTEATTSTTSLFVRDSNNNNKNALLPVEVVAESTSVPANTVFEKLVQNSVSTTTSSSSSHPIRIPSVLLAGTQQGATTSISNYLRTLSNANAFCFANPETNFRNGKEAHFFNTHSYFTTTDDDDDDDDNDDDDVTDGAVPKPTTLQEYSKKYDYCGTNENNYNNNRPIQIDATPDTMLYPERVRAIYDEYETYKTTMTTSKTKDNNNDDDDDTLKVIMILREPVAREISKYQQLVQLIDGDDPDNLGWGAILQPQQSQNGTTVMDTFEEYSRKHIIPTILRPNRTTTTVVVTNTTTNTTNITTTIVIDETTPNYRFTYGYYAHHIRKWIELFQRDTILFLSFDELQTDPTTFIRRIHTFLNLPVPSATTDIVLPHDSILHDDTTTTTTTIDAASKQQPSCAVQCELNEYYREYNTELYTILQNNPPSNHGIEQFPFPEFRISKCCYQKT